MMRLLNSLLALLKNSKAFTIVVFAAALFATLTFTRISSAYPTGVDTVGAGGCNDCHGGGGTGWSNTSDFGTPSGGGATLVGSTWYIDPNGTVSLSWTTKSSISTIKGFNVSNSKADTVTFIAATLSGNAQLTPSNTLTHKDRGGPGDEVYSFQFRAPSGLCRDVELVGWGNTINDTTSGHTNYTNNIARMGVIDFKTKCDLGTACSLSNTCSSGVCVDGVCCNRGCGAECETCLGTPSASRGTCGNRPSGAPRSGAPRFGSCGGSGVCAGQCGGVATCVYPTPQCRGPACSTDGAVPAGYCSGGSCPAAPAPTSCGAYTCNAFGGCGTGCSSDSECVAGSYCAAGACKAKNADGVACGALNECTSNFCVDGVCCDNACSGQCSTCSGPSKGTCSPVTGAPTGGRAACATDGVSTCGGACDGASLGACAYPTAECRAGTCASGVATVAASCDGAGNCPLTVTKACAPFACLGTACASTCIGDTDCGAASYCSAGACVPKSIVGDGCLDSKACSTGFCVDGVCCNRTCNGQCEACDVGGKVGTCVNVTDAPHGTRTACAAGTDGCPTACDGTNATACSPATCDAGIDSGPDTAVADSGLADADESGAEAGDETGGDGGDASGASDASVTEGGEAGNGDGDANENANCACRTSGPTRTSGGLSFVGLALGLVMLGQRRRVRTARRQSAVRR